MCTDEKKISDMIEIISGEITEYVKGHKIDAIVNAANPTLMGSMDPGVDRSIHNTINKMREQKNIEEKFKDLIRKEVDGDQILDEKIIRCVRGKAVITSGDELCKYVIHVVGTEYDGFKFEIGQKKIKTSICTSSCIQKLESCYGEIIKVIKEHPDITTVAIPIISSGNYGIPFEVATRVAIATIGNVLMEWKYKDNEFFNMSSIKKIYFCIYDRDKAKEQKYFQKALKILQEHKKIFNNDSKSVYQKSIRAHFRYLWEIIKYDRNKGYFALAKTFRAALLILRIFFLPILCVKDWFAGYNWQMRRMVVEVTVFVKLLAPILLYFFVNDSDLSVSLIKAVTLVILYLMADTITYLITLIVLSDIQRPSANVIRSMIFLLVNYVEVSLDIALIYYLNNINVVSFREAIKFGILSDSVDICKGVVINEVLEYLNYGLKFFFMTLAFGYFANHLHQRKFVS